MAKDNYRRFEVQQGKFAVAKGDVVLTTVLGSCVGVCLLDPENDIGGLNHFMLPEYTGRRGMVDPRFGDHSMALLYNSVIARGARAENLQAKVYGGSSTIQAYSGIGPRNVEVAMEFLERHGVPVFGGAVDGPIARRIDFVISDADVVLREYPLRHVIEAEEARRDEPRRFAA